MIIQVDKWQVLGQADAGCSFSYDLRLENAQIARLNVVGLINPFQAGPPVPEIFVYCEMPGERLDHGGQVRRWIARPPHSACEWSHVELPDQLMKEIHALLSSNVP
jgi:hypothetical protein